MTDGTIGMIGSDVLTYSISTKLEAELPQIKLLPVDDILSNARKVKTKREQESIREPYRIGSKAMELLMNNVSVNKTESEVIAPAIEYIISQGTVLYFVVTYSGKQAHSAHVLIFQGITDYTNYKKEIY